MKVIDLLNKIANGEDVPEKVRVLDNSLIPEYQIITWNENLKLYEYKDGDEFDRVLDKHHLNIEIEIIEDTPKEDKKIEKLKNLNTDYNMERKKYGALSNEEIVLDIQTLKKYINEIIDRLNGEE